MGGIAQGARVGGGSWRLVRRPRLALDDGVEERATVGAERGSAGVEGEAGIGLGVDDGLDARRAGAVEAVLEIDEEKRGSIEGRGGAAHRVGHGHRGALSVGRGDHLDGHAGQLAEEAGRAERGRGPGPDGGDAQCGHVRGEGEVRPLGGDKVLQERVLLAAEALEANAELAQYGENCANSVAKADNIDWQR